MMLDDLPNQNEQEPLPFDIRVKHKRNDVFFDHATGNMTSFLIGAVFLCIVLQHYNASQNAITLWMALTAVVVLITVLFERSVRKSDAQAATPSEKWIRYRLIIGVLNAIIYGITPLLLPENVDPAAELYLFIILSTLVTVASSAYSTIPKFIYLLSFFSMGPLALYFFSRADQFHFIMGMTTVIWTLIVLKKAADVSRTTIKQIVDSEKLQDEIRQHQIVKQQIRAMAHYDLLTGIANRRLLESMINRSINRAKRENGKVGFIIIDLDNFKPINDKFGHQAGDTILKHVAKNLSDTIRSSDLVARIGGDEFCVILEDAIDADQVQPMLNKLSEIISLPVTYAGSELSVDASLGYSQLPEDGDSMDSLMRVADIRMYEAKRERKLIPVEEF